MSEEAQGVQEAPSIQLNPETVYSDPQLKELYAQQYPDRVEKEEGQEDQNLPPPKDTKPKEGEEKVEVKAPKTPEKKEEVKEEAIDHDAVNAQNLELVKKEIPAPFQSYVDEYYKNDGKLSKESLQKIKEDHGYDSDSVDAYIKTFAENFELKKQVAETKAQTEASKAEQEAAKVIAELHTQVGGEEEWNAMVEWASTEAPKDVVDEYNDLIENPDTKVVRLAVKNLYNAYRESQPKTPQYLKTQQVANAAPANRPFANKFEQQQAYADSRYNTDQAYTQQVHARTQATLGN